MPMMGNCKVITSQVMGIVVNHQHIRLKIYLMNIEMPVRYMDVSEYCDLFLYTYLDLSIDIYLSIIHPHKYIIYIINIVKG